MSLRIPHSAYELHRELEKDPYARKALHEAMKEFPSPDEVSAVVGAAFRPADDEDGMDTDSSFYPRATVFEVCVIVHLLLIVLLLAVIAVRL